MTVPANSVVPIYLVTGFLGSGKTTLISALLKQPDMEGTAVIVNEFGAVGIDDAIFAESASPGDVLLLANGCLCCTARSDINATVRALIERESGAPSKIVIETTGLADPVPVLISLMADSTLQKLTRPGGVIATIDAVNGISTLSDHPVAARQAAIADLRIITKSDIAGETATAAVADTLARLHAATPVRYVSHGRITALELFAAATFDPFADTVETEDWVGVDRLRSRLARESTGNGGPSGPSRHDGMATWLIEESRPVDWSILSRRLGVVIGRYGDSVARIKGIIQTTEDRHPLVLHCVQRLLHPPVRLTRPVQGHGSSIVVIGNGHAAEAVAAIRAALDEAVPQNADSG
jgi:G3E family GTPase